MSGKLKYIWANRKAYIHRYLWPLPKFRREIVVMVDGIHTHGGLTDRFRNILSIYSYCDARNVPFKLFYIYPHNLEEILIPNDYDWRITRKDISFHIIDSEEIDLEVHASPETGEWNSLSAQNYFNKKHLSLLDDKLSCGRKIQYHEYGNAYFAKGHYAALFSTLFKPSAYLQEYLSKIVKEMPEPYESVTLRFQMLLGDLYEGNYEVLDEQAQEELISKCISKIEELKVSHYFSTQKVLVTSDSFRFLERIADKEYIYTIPGKMEHMDYTHNSDIKMNAKPFVDLFLLKKAQRLTLLKTGKMYKSGFPAFAAELGGKPFNIIDF